MRNIAFVRFLNFSIHYNIRAALHVKSMADSSGADMVLQADDKGFSWCIFG